MSTAWASALKLLRLGARQAEPEPGRLALAADGLGLEGCDLGLDPPPDRRPRLERDHLVGDDAEQALEPRRRAAQGGRPEALRRSRAKRGWRSQRCAMPSARSEALSTVLIHARHLTERRAYRKTLTHADTRFPLRAEPQWPAASGPCLFGIAECSGGEGGGRAASWSGSRISTRSAARRHWREPVWRTSPGWACAGKSRCAVQSRHME